MNNLNEIEVFSDDLKQYYYCKRKIFFRRALNARFKPKLKMKMGKEIEENIEIPTDSGEILLRNYYIYDVHLKLGALIDAIIFSKNYAKIIEIKSSRYTKRIDENHKMQLTLQVYLVKKKFPKLSIYSYVYYNDIKKFEQIKLDTRHYQELQKAIEEIRKITYYGILPDKPHNIAKCSVCEYKNYCVDTE